MFAGEHIAGTVFVLGLVMVLHGVSAFDFFIGLLIGNVLGVFNWAFLTAPVAVKTVLIRYWHQRKICGPYLTIAYTTILAMVLGLVAGSIEKVSVTALSIPNANHFEGKIAWFGAIYIGLMFVLLGAIIFTEVQIFPKKIGLDRNDVKKHKILFSWRVLFS